MKITAKFGSTNLISIFSQNMDEFENQFKHSKVFILWYLNTDKMVKKKTRLHLVFSTSLSVFRNQRKNAYILHAVSYRAQHSK